MNDESLTRVLIEFHQRGQAETRSVGVPPPFQITSSVAQLGAARMEEPQRRDDPPLAGQTVSVKPEIEFDFGQYHYVNTSAYTFTLQMQLAGHNSSAIPTTPLSINVYNAVWWTTLIPASNGTIRFVWDRGSWLPAKHGATPTVATGNCSLVGIPVLPPQVTRASYNVSITLGLQFAEPPYAYVDNIFLFGERQEVWAVHNEVNAPYILGGWSNPFP